MSARVLVVRDEANSLTALSQLPASLEGLLEFTFVDNRKQALSALSQAVFDRIITPLKIPRVSDGYLFLGHLVKNFRSNDIIVVAATTQGETRRSMQDFGIDNLFEPDNLHGIINALRPAASSVTAADSIGSQEMDAGFAEMSNFDNDTIRAALQRALGPVGDMILDDVLRVLGQHAEPAALIRRIAEEIDDPEEVSKFHKILHG